MQPGTTMQPGQQQPPAYQQGTPQQQPAYQQGTPQQQPMVVQHQPVVVQQQPVVAVQQGTSGMTNAVSRKWCWKGLRITGYMQIIFGCLSVLFGIISIVVRTFLFVVGAPIWCGILFFVITGILGLAAGMKQRTGLIVGYMVMSIMSSLAASVVFGFGAGVIPRDLWMCPEDWYGGGYRQYSHSYGCATSSSARVGIDVCLLLIGLAEFVVAIVGASFTCVCLSASRNSTPRTRVTYQAYRQPMVVGAPPQGVYYPPGTNQVVMQPQTQYVMQPQPQYVMQPQTQYVMQPQTQYAVQPTQQVYQAQPQGQFQPPPQGQMQPPPQGQMQPPPQGQMQPPPQAQVQPPPQEEEKVHPEAPLSNEENMKQPLTN